MTEFATMPRYCLTRHVHHPAWHVLVNLAVYPFEVEAVDERLGLVQRNELSKAKSPTGTIPAIDTMSLVCDRHLLTKSALYKGAFQSPTQRSRYRLRR